jgi:UDP-glucose 4-epimerase
MANVLVTGGSGFIGSHLVDKLIALGHDVTNVDFSNRFDNPLATKRFVNILDRSHMQDVYDGMDYVFHTASQARVQPSIHDPLTSIETNAVGTAKVLELSRKAGVKRVIYSMTSSVYGSHPAPHTEDLPPQPLSPYAVSKLAGENLCKVYSDLYNLDTVSLRYFNVYGPREPEIGEYTTLIKKFLTLKKENKPLTIVGDGEQRRDFTHVSDIVAANIAAMDYQDRLNGEIFNIGSGKNYSVNQIASLISDNIIYTPARLGEAKETLADNTKAKKILGWMPQQSVESYISTSLLNL